MSEGKRIPRDEALALANQVMDTLRPVCERIEIAGSLRRMNPDVGDIEIVCIPELIKDLLGEGFRASSSLARLISYEPWYMHGVKGGEHYQQYCLDLCNLDLFITTPEQWGMIYMIRTGSADFTRRMVTPRSKGGLMPSNLNVSEGRLWQGERALETPEEDDIFRIYNMAFIEPWKRTL